MKKKKFFIYTIGCLFLSLCMALVPVSTQAASLSELRRQQSAAQSNVDALKKKKADQQAIKNALDKEISATQALMDACTAKINSYNAKINEKQAEIDAKNAEIEQDKAAFKKRIRTIYMCSSQTDVQILLGADSFTDYLTLSQMTKSVSSHDKALVEKLVDAISQIEQEQQEIAALAEEQKAAKEELAAERKTLDAKVAEVNSVINGLQHDIEKDQAAMKQISDEIDRQSAPPSSNIRFDGSKFLWPSATYTYISAYYASNDSVHKGNHKGIDIAGSGIKGTPVRATADGVVYSSNGGCTHNYNKNYSCGCGGGYGNFVAIDHGTSSDGNHYKSLYGHMGSIAVSNGTSVKKGQIIGYVGTTGWSTGPHIHFEMIVNGVKVNPLNYSYQR